MATGYPSSRKLRQRADLSVRPTEQGCPGKLLRRQSDKNRRPNFVLAGLDPAIHALGCSKQRRGCAGQARARRSEIVSLESDRSQACRKTFSGQPCAFAGMTNKAL